MKHPPAQLPAWAERIPASELQRPFSIANILLSVIMHWWLAQERRCLDTWKYMQTLDYSVIKHLAIERNLEYCIGCIINFCPNHKGHMSKRDANWTLHKIAQVRAEQLLDGLLAPNNASTIFIHSWNPSFFTHARVSQICFTQKWWSSHDLNLEFIHKRLNVILSFPHFQTWNL